MRVRLSELKRIIRSVVYECYGWPVEKEIPLYGVKSKSWGPENPVDPANKKLKLPKGLSSKSKGVSLKESFNRITSRELQEWSRGNYGYLHEDGDPSSEDPLKEMDLDEVSHDPMDEGDTCSECGGMKEYNEVTCESECSQCGYLLNILLTLSYSINMLLKQVT
jgi:hypothetical protein